MPAAPDEKIDLRGVPCPTNAARALIKIGMMSMGETLEILIDKGQPSENVPPALQEEGHEILEMQEAGGTHLVLLIKVGH